MIDAQMWIYNNRPGEYAAIHFKVNLCVKHTYKPCIGEDCDLDYRCKRHARTPEVVERYLRRLA